MTEVTCDIGNSGSHSECTVQTVTVSVGGESYRHVTEVTCDIGNSGSYSECTVHTVTVSVRPLVADELEVFIHLFCLYFRDGIMRQRCSARTLKTYMRLRKSDPVYLNP